MDETFRPRERIKKRNDFQGLYADGTRYKGKYFILIYQARHSDCSRLGVVVSKKHGNAVHRNRIKRLLRTLFRTTKDLLQSPVDLVLIPKKGIRTAEWISLRNDYRRAIESIQATVVTK
ncbi:MAG: ribonuclease P protein component [Acidobacteria bacterium]|nr:ribonuclease P protein component [Acidobacteriota bacterium]